VSRYQNGKIKTNLDFLEQETVSSNGISWAMCKSPPRPSQITTPAPQIPFLPPNQQHQSTEGINNMVYRIVRYSGPGSKRVKWRRKKLTYLLHQCHVLLQIGQHTIPYSQIWDLQQSRMSSHVSPVRVISSSWPRKQFQPNTGLLCKVQHISNIHCHYSDI